MRNGKSRSGRIMSVLDVFQGFPAFDIPMDITLLRIGKSRSGRIFRFFQGLPAFEIPMDVTILRPKKKIVCFR